MADDNFEEDSNLGSDQSGPNSPQQHDQAGNPHIVDHFRQTLEEKEAEVGTIIDRIKQGLEYAIHKSQLDEDFRLLDIEARAFIDMAHQVEFISKLEALKARLNTTIDNYLIIRAQAPAAIPVKPKKNVHLQRITVPIFDGKLMEWRSWWQLYQTAVHNDNEHSDVEKFTYLLTFIGPEVKRVLGNLDPTAENYPIAIDKIVDKYDKPELLKAAYYKALEDTHESTTPTAHRRNIESISSIIANLNAIGVPVDQDILRTKELEEVVVRNDEIIIRLKDVVPRRADNF